MITGRDLKGGGYQLDAQQKKIDTKNQ